MRNLDVWYAHVQVQEGLPGCRRMLDKKSLKEAERIVEKARTKDSIEAFDKLTHVVDGEPRIVERAATHRPCRGALTADQAATVPGARSTSSIAHLPSEPARGSPAPPGGLPLRPRGAQGGRRGQRRHPRVDRSSCSVATTPIRSSSRPRRPRTRCSRPSSARAGYANQGQRVVEGQRLMQAASDIFLGWERAEGLSGDKRDFYIRQLRDWKGSWPPEAMDPQRHERLRDGCARRTWLARTPDPGDRIAIASYLGRLGRVRSLDRAVRRGLTPSRTERDYQALKDAAARRIGCVDDVSGVRSYSAIRPAPVLDRSPRVTMRRRSVGRACPGVGTRPGRRSSSFLGNAKKTSARAEPRRRRCPRCTPTGRPTGTTPSPPR